MPIDFLPIALAFARPLRMETKTMTLAFERLGRWLLLRLTQARVTERATKEIPSLRFQYDDLAVRIDRSQHRSLAPGGVEPPWWKRLAGPFVAFGKGVGRQFEATVGSELALSRLLSTLAAAAAAVAGSMDRFDAPDKLFARTLRHTASDLFGQAALLFRALPSSTDQVLDAVRGMLRLRDAFSSGGGEKGGGLLATLEETIPYVAGALVLVPVAMELLFSTLRSLDLALRLRLLEMLAGIEAQVFALRSDVLTTLFGTLADLGRDAWDVLVVLKVITVSHLEFFVRAARLLPDQSTAIYDFLKGLSDALRYWFEAVPLVIEAIMGFSLKPFLKVPLTIGDLLDQLPENLVEIDVNALLLWLAPLLAPGIPSVVIRSLPPIFHFKAILPPETGLPPETLFPDLHDSFAPGLPGLTTALGDLQTGLTTGLDKAFGESARALEQTAASSTATADRFVKQGPERYAALAGHAAGFAEATFGTQREELEKKIARSSPDALAQAFEGALVRGGFHAIAAAVPVYVAEMRRYYDRMPTSPHILERRRRLERVRLPSMTLRVPGAKLDDALLATVKARFRQAVQEAWRAGEARLAGGTAAP